MIINRPPGGRTITAVLVWPTLTGMESSGIPGTPFQSTRELRAGMCKALYTDVALSGGMAMLQVIGEGGATEWMALGPPATEIKGVAPPARKCIERTDSSPCRPTHVPADVGFQERYVGPDARSP